MFRTLRTYQHVVDACLAAALFVMTLPFSLIPVQLYFGPGPDPRQMPIGILVAAVLCGALAIRRWSPALALAAAWVAAIVQMICLLPPLPVNIAIFGVLYVTSAYGSRRLMWLGFASAIAGGIVIGVYLIAPSFTGAAAAGTEQFAVVLLLGVSVTAAGVFALALSWVTGVLVRTRTRARVGEREKAVAEALAAVEQERVRIARDMHDVVAHSLAVVIAQADGARYAAAANPRVAADALTTISATARGALADVRLLLTQLRHAQGEGPQPTLADLESLYAQVRAAGVELRVEVVPTPLGDPPGAVQLAVYRILQEALTNALRHGGGVPVDVRLAWFADRVDLAVTNDAPPPSGTGGGHGLIGMRERAQLVGGRLDAGHDGHRFVVSAAIPLQGAA